MIGRLGRVGRLGALALLLVTQRAAAEEPDPPPFDEQTPPPIPVPKSDSPPGYERYLLPGVFIPHPSPPRVLPYEEGQTVPYGYRLRTRRTRSLLVTGSLTFGLAYVTSVIAGAGLVATNGKQNAPLLAPIVGPLVAVGTIGSASATPALVLDGLAQIGGATLLVCGALIDEKLLERTSTLDAVLHPRVVATPRSIALAWALP